MIKRAKIISTLSLVIVSALFWFVNSEFPNIYLQKGLYTLLALTVIYFVFKLVFEELVAKGIKEPKTRYSFKKTVSIIYLAFFLLVVVGIWVEEPQNIFIAYGLVGAGIAISLQDVFKNFIGGIIIFINGIYHVGDRIEISQKYGDVIDINILYTTLMEMKGWVAGDQATGRLMTIPNGFVLTSTIHNYTKDYDFIWDEISIPITYDSDWNEANTRILDIVKRETKSMSERAEKDISRIGEKYYLSKRSVEPAIFLTLTDNWITFNIRYVTEARQRRLLHNKLSRMILNEIEKSEKIKIASTTLNITGFPQVRLRKDK